MQESKPLIDEEAVVPFDLDTLTGTIDMMLHNIEESLLANGAVPKIDYTYKDLFAMALPFALEIFKKSIQDGKPLYYYNRYGLEKDHVGKIAQDMYDRRIAQNVNQ